MVTKRMAKRLVPEIKFNAVAKPNDTSNHEALLGLGLRFGALRLRTGPCLLI